MFRIAIGGDELPPDSDLVGPIPGAPSEREGTENPAVRRALNLGMLMGGVHLFTSRGITSIAHSEEDVEQTVNAFADTLERMQEAGVLDD